MKPTPSPATSKFTKASLPAVGCSYEKDRPIRDGFTFELADYPGISLFVYKNDRINTYFIVEASSGLKCGTECSEKTRSGAIQKQWEAFESMRNSPNGQGDPGHVKRMVDKCLKRLHEKATA